MLKSMTGFGDAQREEAGYGFLLEIKSLNNRFLKTSVRLPDTLTALEPQVEKIIRSRLSRGSVTFTLHMRNVASSAPYEINQPSVEQYLVNIKSLTAKNKHVIDAKVSIGDLLQLPGVLQQKEYSEEEQASFSTTIASLTEEALAKLQKMRTEEGAILVKDLQNNCNAISENLNDLSKLTDHTVEHYRNRLISRADAMLTDANITIDQDQLLREVTLFAERSDINEEITRLAAHLAQFDKFCKSDAQVGRKLDFLTQEMLREANTIASKCNHATISHHVVEIKVAIDRLKEQIQNIE
jgi:uncharacterized protein (TIGR00255 family)